MNNAFGKSDQFVVLANNDFELRGTFQIDALHPAMDHCYIYSGLIDYAWLVGVNRHQQLSLWLGNGISWNLYNGLALDCYVEKNRQYEIRLTRIGDILTVDVDQRRINTLTLPRNYNILGSHLGVGIMGKTRSLWNMKIDIPYLRISSSTPHSPAFGKKINLISVFYGASYSDALQEIMFPSLLLEQNIPALKGREISHYIYCSENEVASLQKHVVMLKNMGIECIVNANMIPASGNQRDYLYLPFLKEMERSIAESSIVVMAQPDHVFGRGLAKIIDAMKPYEYVVCGHPRVSEERGRRRYPEFLSDQLRKKSSGNRDFVSLAINELTHPMVAHGLMHMEPYWHAIRRQSYLSVYFKEPPPLCFHAHPEMINVVLGDTVFGRFETIDHDLVDFAYQQKRLKIIDDSDEFFWTELTKDDVYNPTIYNKYWSEAARTLFHHELKWHLA
jgi:hypothetical protein